MRAYLLAFFFTQAVEVPIYVRGFGCSGLAAFGASLITHPIVWFVIFNSRWHWSYWTGALIAELFAWLAEAAYFGLLLRYRRSLCVCLLANAASLLAGLLSRGLFGVP